MGYGRALGKYREWADAYGITHTVLFAAFHSDYAIANRQVAAIVARNRARYHRLRVRPSGSRSRARSPARRHRGRTIWLPRHQGPPPRRPDHERDLRRRAGFRRARPLRVMGEVSVVHLLATEYPDVAFIIPHLGSFADDWRAQAALIPILARHTETCIPTRLEFADLSYCRRRCNVPGRAKCSSARTGRGCTQAWSSKRSARFDCPPKLNGGAGRQPPSPDRSRETQQPPSSPVVPGRAPPPRAEDPWAAEQFVAVARRSLSRHLDVWSAGAA